MNINICNQIDLDCLKSLATIIAPLITFLAVIVALIAAFRDQILGWFYKPELDIAVEMKPPDWHKAKISVGKAGKGDFH